MADTIPPIGVWLLHPAFTLGSLPAQIKPIAQQQWLNALTLWLPTGILLLSFLPWRKVTSRFIEDFVNLSDLDTVHFVHIDSPRWKKRLLLVMSTIAVPLSLGVLAFNLVRAGLRGDAVLSAALAVMSWAYSSFHIVRNDIRRPPGGLMLIWLSRIIADLSTLVIECQRRATVVWPLLVTATLAVAAISLAGTYPLSPILPAKNVAKPGSQPTQSETCPEDAVTFWGWMTFGFVEPLIQLAGSRTLTEADVWQLSPFFQHRNLFQKFLISPMTGKESKGWILWRLVRWNKIDLMIELLTELWSTVVSFVATYALKRILDALAAGGRRNEAATWAAVHFLCNLSFAQFDLFGRWHSRRCYERTRGQLFNILHHKALRRKDKSTLATAITNSKKEQEETEKSSANIGKISNLMGGDAYIVAERFWGFAAVVTSPLKLALSLIFLYKLLGISALLGSSMVALAYLLNWPLIKFDVMQMRRSNAKYLWAGRVEEARRLELKLRVKQMLLSTVISFIWIWVPTAILLVSFWSLTTLFGRPLTVSIAFTSISLFAQLQGALRALPNQITSWLRAYVSVKRIEDFLAEEDVPQWVCGINDTSRVSVAPGQINFCDEAIFAWSSQADDFRIGPLSLSLPAGRLTLVTGPTGSGKSTFLAAILGEIGCVEGRVEVEKAGGALAYASQSPWLESMSIRDNILFETAWDKSRYEYVIDACALRQDLAIFPHGDLTEIGEKGISLSGGQKARIALARALYSSAKTVLLDDPLAAVDMFTARKLVDDGLRSSLLKDRTVVLVTHHIRLCRSAADFIIELRDGKVVYAGPPSGFEQSPAEEVDDTVSADQDSEEVSGNETINTASLKNAVASGGESTGANNLIEPEKRSEGRVTGYTYRTYFRAAGFRYWFFLVILVVYTRLSAFAVQWALKTWGEAYPGKVIALFNWPDPTSGFPSPDLDVHPWLNLYLMISINSGLVILLGLCVGNFIALKASKNLFSAMLIRVVRAPTRWSDMNFTGRILNRFVSDIDTVDFSLQGTAEGAIRGVIGFLVSLGIVIWVVPSFTPLAILIAWLYIRLGPAYVKVARDLRRLESVSRSPMFQNFSNLLHGIQSIRAYAAEARYQNLFYKACDTFQTMDHHYWLANFWLMWRYDCLGSVVVFLTTIFALVSGVDEGYAAISVVQAEMFASATRALVSVFAQVELDFNAIERVTEYLKIPQEAPAIIEDARPPAYWPSDSAGLIVEGLVVRYAPHLPAALNGLSFDIAPNQKVGVVGRTGSGKSTLAMSLLRIIEAEEGKIILDGIDVCRIGLEDLRTRITIVSQDVTLFEGSVRTNLDPLNLHSDEEMWEVLRKCNLASTRSEVLVEAADDGGALIEGLDMRLSEGGKSFSAGQRQLLALARAMLRESKMVIMDEATSSIDLVTDDKIQSTIRECMKSSMVITIAHRLLTVIDYDKIIVLEEGKIIEFDTPKNLLERKDGHFRKLCETSADADILFERSSASDQILHI
ncbi:P-loop containing nucleoside triphosphate hydrolase protein [Melampsora americana]|nr:P-loop containing nucleoside triphosphate hydrolase protein [Melampsora americana]